MTKFIPVVRGAPISKDYIIIKGQTAIKMFTDLLVVKLLFNPGVEYVLRVFSVRVFTLIPTCICNILSMCSACMFYDSTQLARLSMLNGYLQNKRCTFSVVLCDGIFQLQ